MWNANWRTAVRPNVWLLAALILCLLNVYGSPAGAQTAAARQAKKPNFDVHIYRRANTPDEKISLSLSAFNEHAIQFSAHRLSLPALVPTSKALENFGKQLKEADLARLPAVRTWMFDMGKIYPDQWTEREVRVPTLPPGAYLIRARAGMVEKRTWLAVTSIALLAKRSRQELLVYATNAHSGQPVPGLKLDFTDVKGRTGTQATDGQGMCRLPLSAAHANTWIYGEQAGSPAFVLSDAPPPPEPYAIYVVSDRPVYRPGHKVQFKGTVRQRVEADAPGGYAYRVFANREATVEIRDATDALLSRQKVTTNANGSFDGAFQLAGETTLGNWQVVVSVGAFRAYAAFAVEAYRKPEFSVDVKFGQPHYVGGSHVTAVISARYYFGQPVANAPVFYGINFQPEDSYAPGNEGRHEPEPPYNGQGVTDAQGQLTLDIPTQRLPLNRRLLLHAALTDLSRRQQQAESSVLITGGLFHLRLETDKSVYRAGERMNVSVHAEDYDGKPVAAKGRVRLIETRVDRNHRPFKETTTRDVVTNSSGEGIVTFTPPRPGYLTLAVEAIDRESNKIETQLTVWVAGNEAEGYEYPTLSLLADRATYHPGDTATILLNTSLVTPHSAAAKPARPIAAGRKRRSPDEDDEAARPTYPQAWALVTVEGERLYARRVVPLHSRSTTLQIPLLANEFPSVEVSVTIVQEKQIYQQQARLAVTGGQQKLRVEVTPDKARYQPGETATYVLTTRNAMGNPVPAEIGFGVVDAAIYAIQPDRAPDVESFFYPGQQIRIQTDFSFAAQYSGGAFQTVPTRAPEKPGASGSSIRVRRQFADTAYWNPFITTDAQGRAQVAFTVPDNLTTWRATARGITTQTAVGSATRDVIATMPLLVRLTLPRFYVQGDHATVSAIVHNYTGAARDVHARIEATGAELEGETGQTLHLAPGEEQRLDWTARIRAPRSASSGSAAFGNAAFPLAAAGSARFLVTADGGAGAQDAMELILPALEDGVKQVEAKAETFDESGTAYRLDFSQLPANATVTLTLAPSVASAMLEALEPLESYPYGCAEQTMSSFLPDVIVARTLRRLHVTRQTRPNLNQWVNLGLQKLYRYQHADGGWNWWEFDQTDGDMTAYVLWGLAQARDAGYTVDEQRILRGTESLLRMLPQEGELNRRAEWLLTLASLAPARILPPLTNLYDNREKLDTYALGSLCLALAKENGVTAPTGAVLPDFGMLAQGVAKELEAKAVEQGTTAYWPAAPGGYTWRNDDVEVTARVLRALLTAAPRSPLVPKAVRWLMGNRQGKAWTSTRSSAEAVFALAQSMEQTKELEPNYQARILLDGQAVKTFAPTARQAFDVPFALTLSPADRQGHSAISIDKVGAGRLYVTTTVAYTIPAAEAKPVRKGIAVRRAYRVRAEDPSRADGVASGETLEVEVDITADAEYRYAMVEEPIPAGCEVEPGDDQFRPSNLVFETGTGGYVRQETHDNRVVFFFDQLPKGRTHLTYRLHAETPGTYRILPSLASLVYFPEIRGSSVPAHARITEKATAQTP